jgi:hypothetical protein
MLAHCPYASGYPNYVDALLGADKLDAIGLPCLHLNDEQTIYVSENIKCLNTYLKENNARNFSYHAFKRWCDFEKVRNKLGNLANQLDEEMYSALLWYEDNYSIEELGVCAYYLTRGKLWEYHRHNVDKLVDYIRMCRKMGKAPEKVNNFMREYCETHKEYELRKTEFDNKQLRANYAKHSKAWEFAYGDYVVSIPTCGQEIVTEGREMHHCVGSYVDKVVAGSTYICFVRHKDTPNECYITCQVHTDGRIGQYFLAYDRHIHTNDDIAFKTAFADHLREVWGE